MRAAATSVQHQVEAYPVRRRDEDNGFLLTAAMQWGKAAELSSWITPLAIRYWREWERIMQVPCRLGAPR
jgi:hypothetical protein